MKSKIKSYGDDVTDFHDKEIAKVESNRICLISLGSALKKDENYLQVFLKECKYIKKKVIKNIIDDTESSSDDSDESDEE